MKKIFVCLVITVLGTIGLLRYEFRTDPKNSRVFLSLREDLNHDGSRFSKIIKLEPKKIKVPGFDGLEEKYVSLNLKKLHVVSKKIDSSPEIKKFIQIANTKGPSEIDNYLLMTHIRIKDVVTMLIFKKEVLES